MKVGNIWNPLKGGNSYDPQGLAGIATIKIPVDNAGVKMV